MFESELNARGVQWPAMALIVAAGLCTLGPLGFDIEEHLRLSLQSLLVCWLPLMLGWRAGVSGVIAYLCLGAAGLPVFAGYRGGLDILAGPTGGYLMGMPVAALVLGATTMDRPSDLSDRRRYIQVGLGMVLGHVIILASGIPWQRNYVPELDILETLEVFYRPALIKSALGILLTVIVIRVKGARA